MDGDRNESAELAHDSYFVSGSLSVRGAVQSAWPGRGGSHRTSLSVTDSRYGLLRPDAGRISTPGCTNVNRLHRNPARINRLCGKTPPTGQLCCLLTGARSIDTVGCRPKPVFVCSAVRRWIMHPTAGFFWTGPSFRLLACRQLIDELY